MYTARILMIYVIVFSFVYLKAQEKTTLTDSLVHQFHKYWNNNDLDGMLSFLHPDAFFNSPYQLRYSRDTMAATVLLSNPPRIKDCTTYELYSHVEENLAWSIGYLYCSYYDSNGKLREKVIESNYDKMRLEFYDKDGNWIRDEEIEATKYTYIFSKDQKGDWKVKILLYHESN